METDNVLRLGYGFFCFGSLYVLKSLAQSLNDVELKMCYLSGDEQAVLKFS